MSLPLYPSISIYSCDSVTCYHRMVQTVWYGDRFEYRTFYLECENFGTKPFLDFGTKLYPKKEQNIWKVVFVLYRARKIFSIPWTFSTHFCPFWVFFQGLFINPVFFNIFLFLFEKFLLKFVYLFSRILRYKDMFSTIIYYNPDPIK